MSDEVPESKVMDRIRHAVETLTEGRLASFDGATGWLNSEP